MEIAFLLFDGITPLDATGPFEVLGKLPGAEFRMVAKEKGEVRTKGQSLAMIADYALADVAKPEILVVPGDPGADAMAGDGAVTDWLSRAHETTTWTTSVCTGEDIAKAIQLAIEYAPEPPFDAGRYRDAPPDRVEKVRLTLNQP